MGKHADAYLKEWRAKGYTGNYVPQSIRDMDAAEAEFEKLTGEEALPLDYAQQDTDPTESARANNFVTGFAVVVTPTGDTLIIGDLTPENVASLTVDRSPSPDEVRRLAHEVYEFEAHRRIAAFVHQASQPHSH